nr:BPK_HP1_G0043480.mRNA.1.CDS.1 [Saccharomyces cerevisiae]
MQERGIEDILGEVELNGVCRRADPSTSLTTWNDPSDPTKGFPVLILSSKRQHLLKDSGKGKFGCVEHKMVY